MKTLADYQRRMVEIADEAKPLLHAGSPADVPRLGALRLNMAQTLMSYQLYFHREIFAAYLADPHTDRATRQALGEAKTECIVLADAFHRHTLRWASESAETNWDIYAQTSIELGLRIRNHVARVHLLTRSLPLAA